MKKLVFLTLSAFMALTTISCKDSSSPKETAEKFFTALQSEKFDEAKKYATKESQSIIDMVSSLAKAPGADKKEKKAPGKVETSNEKIEGETATVDVKEEGKAKTTTLNLKKEDGQWKVAFDKSSIMKMGAKDRTK